MRPVLKTLLAAAALSAAVFAVQAQTQMASPPMGAAATPQVDARQARQHARIADGAATGALTPHERHRLHKQQRAIRHTEAHAKADGVVTPHEKRHLAKLQAKSSRAIHRQKHDGQKVGPKPASAT